MEKRNQFTFYRSWFEAISRLNKSQQGPAFAALCAYALDGVEPTVTGPAATVLILAKPILDSSRKKAASGRRGGQANTQQTGSKPEATAKQTESKPEANGKQEEPESTPEALPNQEEAESKNKSKNKKKNKDYCPYSPLPPEGNPPGACALSEAPPPTSDALPEPPNPAGNAPRSGQTSREAPDAFPGLSPALAGKVRQWLQYKQERREPYKPTGRDALITRIRTSAAEYGDAAVIAVIDASMSSNYAGILFDRLPQQAARNVKMPGGARGENRPLSDLEIQAIQRMMAKD